MNNSCVLHGDGHPRKVETKNPWKGVVRLVVFPGFVSSHLIEYFLNTLAEQKNV